MEIQSSKFASQDEIFKNLYFQKNYQDKKGDMFNENKAKDN